MATAVTYLPAMGLSWLALERGALAGLRLEGRDLEGIVERLYGPVLHATSALVPRAALFVAGVALLLLAFKAFDRALPDLASGRGPLLPADHVVYRPWFMFGVGLVTTAMTLSVSVSISLLVPLAARGFVRRENVWPYILGANVTTLVDTLFAGALVGHPDSARMVALLMGSVGAAVAARRLPVPGRLRPGARPRGLARHGQRAGGGRVRGSPVRHPAGSRRSLLRRTRMDVLVYLDPSPRGEWALAAAAQLPPRWKGTLRLLATAEDAAADPTLVERARARLADCGPVETLTRPGPAERAVIEEARERRYGLLVVPPAGRGAVARMLKGSRVAKVVRRARAPVLVARRPPERMERVLGALSGRDTTAAVLEAALAWEERPGARASFVHVRSEVPLPRGDAAPPPETPGRTSTRPSAPPWRPRPRERPAAARRARRRGDARRVRERGLPPPRDRRPRRGAAGFGREDVTERLVLGCPGSTLIVPR